MIDHTGTILEGKSLYVPREPAKTLDSVVTVYNFQGDGLNLLLLSTKKGYWNMVERNVNLNPQMNPFRVLRWMCRKTDAVHRVDVGYSILGNFTNVETYVPLPEVNMSKFVVPEEPTYVKIVPEADFLAVMKSEDFIKYLNARKELFEKAA